MRILGVGIEPSDGIRKGIIVDLAAATQAITRSVKKAESTSGLEITRVGEHRGRARFVGEQPRRDGGERKYYRAVRCGSCDGTSARDRHSA
ncbi:MAG: hypothetical protein U0X87_03950 [Anaerolineales bacterium]